MKLSNFIKYFLLMTICSFNITTAQSEPDSLIEQEIKSKIDAQYLKKYSITVFNFERLFTENILRRVNYAANDVTDQIRGTVFFSATLDFEEEVRDDFDSSLVGIYKNGTILWATNPNLKGDFSKIEFADDINNDGNIEIGISGYPSLNNMYKDMLLIISWDGIGGRIINEFDSNNESEIVSILGFKLFDWEDDGIMEISCFWPYDGDPERDYFPEENPSPKKPFITYGWNGNKYGFFSNIFQIGGDDFFPANRISVSIKTKVVKINNELDFSYEIKNMENSHQIISDIHTGNVKQNNVVSKHPVGENWVDMPSRVFNGWFWRVNTFGKYFIAPGMTKKGFGFRCECLPSIVNFFIQADRPLPYPIDNEDEYYSNMINDILTNSTIVKTIGPKNPPNPFNEIEFTDSLKSYIEQLNDLGWAQTTQIQNKYENYITNTKTALLQNNISLARTNLQNILRDVDVDSSSAITNEAYALLRYNTEYLLSKLPIVTEPTNDLSAKVSAEITNVNGMLQYRYTITNQAASNQSVANIYVEDKTTSTTTAPANWQTEKVQNKLDRFYTTTNQITAGTTQSGYAVTSNSLPVLGKVYVQSERYRVDTTDIKTNSYIATTVVPAVRPAQINASAFIDTLISNNNRAYTLGWMQYDWVRDNNYYQLNNAKTMINMNVPSSAVIILTAFEGWLDTIKNLTYINNEGYGLLKYNSIYLREKLSGQ